VTDAPEGVRGDSANNVQKAVTIETGITVQVPLFIKTGEKIKIAAASVPRFKASKQLKDAIN